MTGSLIALRVMVSCLLDMLQITIESTQGEVEQKWLDSLRNVHEILTSVEKELSDAIDTSKEI